MAALPDDGSFLERFKRGELGSGADGSSATSATSAAAPIIDPMHPMLLEACKLLTERTAQLTEEQKQYYLQVRENRFIYFHLFNFD
jgi:hypothetical protein